MMQLAPRSISAIWRFAEYAQIVCSNLKLAKKKTNKKVFINLSSVEIESNVPILHSNEPKNADSVHSNIGTNFG